MVTIERRHIQSAGTGNLLAPRTVALVMGTLAVALFCADLVVQTINATVKPTATG